MQCNVHIDCLCPEYHSILKEYYSIYLYHLHTITVYIEGATCVHILLCKKGKLLFQGKSKLQIFMLYLRVTREKDLIKKPKLNPPNKPTCGNRKELQGKNITSIFSSLQSQELRLPSGTEIFSFAQLHFIPSHASSISYTS